ncbi:hypothetical protein BT63DRAFT_418977 [Microthyrium microscopicum]|uniref:Subtilisin-like serine protease n=1 Tax=Microthyrium microscopicum TaxID=703497 RepID=A0A6A6TVZ9_9PEZI|nr:hypothetical protein BT63DRAFT_418977 [Microthyrium microscopicum]
MLLISKDTELNKDLTLVASGSSFALRRSETTSSKCLPGQARVQLDNDNLADYLRDAFCIPSLDKIGSYLRLAFTPDSRHISAIHQQATRGREIIVAENPYLHLVWYYDRVFVKPIPPYLLSSAFWEYMRQTDKDLWQSAAGFMRTYAHLIKYEVDFRKAQSKKLGLIPADDGKDTITYERFSRFIAPFADLPDDQVAQRYHYGEMRLTRLNWFARIFLGKLTYHHIHAQWHDYFGRFLAPFLTVFAMCSMILAATQVILSVERAPEITGGWQKFATVALWFSVLVIVLVMVLFAFIVALAAFMFIHDQLFAWKVRRRNQGRQHMGVGIGETMKSGVV